MFGKGASAATHRRSLPMGRVQAVEFAQQAWPFQPAVAADDGRVVEAGRFCAVAAGMWLSSVLQVMAATCAWQERSSPYMAVKVSATVAPTVGRT